MSGQESDSAPLAPFASSRPSDWESRGRHLYMLSPVPPASLTSVSAVTVRGITAATTETLTVKQFISHLEKTPVLI